MSRRDRTAPEPALSDDERQSLDRAFESIHRDRDRAEREPIDLHPRDPRWMRDVIHRDECRQ